jgi:hypothetical protein
MRWRLPLAMAVCVVVVAGCGVSGSSSGGMSYPAGPSLAQFGVRERCPQGGECSDRAMEAIRVALSRLGPEIQDAPITSNGGDGPPADRLYVEITNDPMLEWRATGAEGNSSAFRIDLTDSDEYIVVAPRLAFRLADVDAAAIRDALFVAR